MIIDGTTHRIVAVASMHNIKNAVTVARAVLERTDHTVSQITGATLSLIPRRAVALIRFFIRQRLCVNSTGLTLLTSALL
jgi:isoaspartyl peptidase/L-asparaginase-like protein (Ntn-hydrolase superfamily)